MSAHPTSLRPAPARPRAKTSSERGRLFRARQRLHEINLATEVESLRQQVARLEHERVCCIERSFLRRHDDAGSLQRKVLEFFHVFQDGLGGDLVSPSRRQQYEHLPTPIADEIAYKERYMRHLYAPDAIVGDLRGVDASIDQWRRYTLFHDNFHITPEQFESTGCPETVRLRLRLDVRISQKTMLHIFPGARHKEHLQRKFLHRAVTYDCSVTLRFNDEGRINHTLFEIDFVGGLLRAGGTIQEVSEMLEHSMIRPLCTLRPSIQEEPMPSRRRLPRLLELVRTREQKRMRLQHPDSEEEVPSSEWPRRYPSIWAPRLPSPQSMSNSSSDFLISA